MQGPARFNCAGPDSPCLGAAAPLCPALDSLGGVCTGETPERRCRSQTQTGNDNGLLDEEAAAHAIARDVKALDRHIVVIEHVHIEIALQTAEYVEHSPTVNEHAQYGGFSTGNILSAILPKSSSWPLLHSSL